MDFTGYTNAQLQVIINAAYRQVLAWPMAEKLTVGSGITYDLLIFPGESLESPIILISHKGKSPILSISKGRHRYARSSKVEDELIKEIFLKYNRFDVELTIANIRCRAKWSQELSILICRQLYNSAPSVFKEMLEGLDLDALLRQEEKQREQAKKYQENKRSREFSLREQQSIGRRVLSIVESSLQPDLNKTIFAGEGSVSIRWSLPHNEYLTQLLTNKLSTESVDLTGEQLMASISRSFNMSVDEILAKLFSTKIEACRRFALQFNDQFNNSGLIDADPKVRLLAKQKVSKQ